MDRLKKFILVIALFCSFLSFAQKNNLASAETIFITTSTTTFVSGDNLFYKVSCLNTTNKKLSDLSKVGYVKLISSNKEEVFTHKLFLKNGTFSSNFFIDSKLKTGSYKLISYTNWMLNNSVNKFAELDIYIINPFIPLTIENSNTESTESPKNEIIYDTSNENFKFLLNKKQFLNREKVNLSFVSKNLLKGNYSLSVRRKEELPFTNSLVNVGLIKNTNPEEINYLDKNTVLPELRGELITGTIANKKVPSEVKNKTIALSISGKEFQTKIVQTNAAGKFIFNVDNSYNNSTQTIQVLENNKDDFTLILDSKKIPDLSNLTFLKTPFLKESYKEILENHSIANQLENAYYSRKTDSLVKIDNQFNFYEPWQKTYILDDYTRFPTLAETITEVIFEMFYIKNKESYTIGLRDFDVLANVPEPPLVMIDGFVIQDLKELFNYKMATVYKISTIQGGYYYGSNVFNGIINVTTKNFDFVSSLSGDFFKNSNLKSPEVLKKYFNPNYSDKSKTERIPDYRYQLLWQPNFNLDNPISFYTSDVKGTFEIILDGFTDEGIPIHSFESFEVK